MSVGRFQLACILVAVVALGAYYCADLAQLARATLVVVRDLKAESRETAAAISRMMSDESEGETNG